MWEKEQRVGLDVRFGPVIGTNSPCGENSENLSKTLSTRNANI